MQIIKPTKITIGDIIYISLIVLTFCLVFQNHKLINSNDKYIRISRNSIETYIDSIGIQLINNVYQIDSINKIIKETQKVEANNIYEEIQKQKRELKPIEDEYNNVVHNLYGATLGITVLEKKHTITLLEQKYLILKYNIQTK